MQKTAKASHRNDVANPREIIFSHSNPQAHTYWMCSI